MKKENPLIRAMTTNDARTQNLCLTNSTSSSDCVDLFFTIGSMRSSINEESKMRELIIMFERAFNENPLIAMKILFWARDIRGGAGEREIFKKITRHLAKNKTDVMLKNLTIIPEYGRFDDLFALFSTPAEKATIDYLVAVLLGDSEMKSLCSKWMPRLGGKVSKEDKLIANKVRVAMGLSPKEYRKLLVKNTNVVETAMCRKDWRSIDYQKIPSLAMSRYMKTFTKHDNERFQSYIEAVESGEAKINTGAIYPYDLIKSLRKAGNDNAVNTQWDNLPNYLEDNDEKMIPMVDVSGSMEQMISGSVDAMDVAISLGIYVSERLEGPFKDHFITFTSQPTLQRLSGRLSDRYNQVRGPVGYNTNISAAFEMLLNSAVRDGVSPEDMPSKILIISDMEFDSYAITGTDSSTFEMIKHKYKEAGYEMPNIIFWRVDVKAVGNFPVKFDTNNTALISGFSPSIMKSILGGDMNPYSIMLKTIGDERYSQVIV